MSQSSCGWVSLIALNPKPSLLGPEQCTGECPTAKWIPQPGSHFTLSRRSFCCLGLKGWLLHYLWWLHSSLCPCQGPPGYSRRKESHFSSPSLTSLVHMRQLLMTIQKMTGPPWHCKLFLYCRYSFQFKCKPDLHHYRLLGFIFSSFWVILVVALLLEVICFMWFDVSLIFTSEDWQLHPWLTWSVENATHVLRQFRMWLSMHQTLHCGGVHTLLWQRQINFLILLI